MKGRQKKEEKGAGEETRCKDTKTPGKGGPMCAYSEDEGAAGNGPRGV